MENPEVGDKVCIFGWWHTRHIFIIKSITSWPEKEIDCRCENHKCTTPATYNCYCYNDASTDDVHICRRDIMRILEKKRKE